MGNWVCVLIGLSKNRLELVCKFGAGGFGAAMWHCACVLCYDCREKYDFKNIILLLAPWRRNFFVIRHCEATSRANWCVAADICSRLGSFRALWRGLLGLKRRYGSGLDSGF